MKESQMYTLADMLDDALVEAASAPPKKTNPSRYVKWAFSAAAATAAAVAGVLVWRGRQPKMPVVPAVTTVLTQTAPITSELPAVPTATVPTETSPIAAAQTEPSVTIRMPTEQPAPSTQPTETARPEPKTTTEPSTTETTNNQTTQPVVPSSTHKPDITETTPSNSITEPILTTNRTADINSLFINGTEYTLVRTVYSISEDQLGEYIGSVMLITEENKQPFIGSADPRFLEAEVYRYREQISGFIKTNNDSFAVISGDKCYIFN